MYVRRTETHLFEKRLASGESVEFEMSGEKCECARVFHFKGPPTKC